VVGLGGVIHIFSGIPEDVPARFYSLRAPGGFLLTGEKRGRVPDYLLVRPTAAGRFRLSNVWKQSVRVVDLGTGQTLLVSLDDRIQLDLPPHHHYLFAPAGFRLEQLAHVPFSLHSRGE